MSKKTKSPFNPLIIQHLETVTSCVNVDPTKPNGYKVSHKKEIRPICSHMLLKKDKRGGPSEARVTIEDDEVSGVSRCLICKRKFPNPDINSDNLNILKQAVGIINSAMVILPWSSIRKKDFQLAIDARNAMEAYVKMYESAVRDISTVKVVDVDTSLKSHVGRL